MIKTKGHQKF